MNKTPDPEWWVYVEDYNLKTIKKFNVFNSFYFLEGCKKSFRKYKDDVDKLEKEIRSWAMYSFWSKCEYEIVLTSFPPKSKEWNFKDIKVDVYQQLMLNWDSFFNYVIAHKAFFLRRDKK